MSREPKDKPKAKPTVPRFNDVKFVNWALSTEEKASCKDWLPTLEEVDQVYLTLIEAGHKVTISYDNFRSCFTASVIPTTDAKANQGYILTGKGSTPLKAFKQAVYIHFLVMNEDWAAYSTAGVAEDFDD